MLCPTCGAENIGEARFCNMCGGAFAPETLSTTQIGLGTVATRAVVDAAIAAHAAQERAKASHAALAATAPIEAVAHAAPEPPRTPSLSLTSSSEVEAERPAPRPDRVFDPSTSLQLEAMGIKTPGQTFALLGASAVALLLLGAGGAYLALRGEDVHHGTAQVDAPFVIGAPTAEVDYVTGSADPAAVGLTTRDAGTGARAPEPGRVPPAPGPTGAVPSTGSVRPVPPSGSTPPPAAPATAPTPTAPAVPTAPTPPTPTPASPPATPTPDPAPDAPASAPADTPTEMDLELYAARVRYLVRRYHGAAAQRCFDEATAREPSVSGQVLLSMRIAADGRVSSASVSRNTTGDDALASCLRRLAESWTLTPPPGGEAVLSFPFSR